MDRSCRILTVVSLAMLAHAQAVVAQTDSMRTAQACRELVLVPIDSASASRMKPDVLIRASVTARELTFATRPSASVKLRGCGLQDTVRVLERTNLPKPVVAGTTYSNVRVAVELLAYLDVECIAAALAGTAKSCADSTTRNQTIPDRSRR